MTDNEMFTLSVSTEVFWAAILGAYFVVFCGILALRNAREQRTEHSGDNWQIEALSGFVGALAPIWIGLFLFLLYLLGKLAWNIPTPATFEHESTLSFFSKQPSSEAAFAEAIRWHILAFVGLLTALGGLITLPLAMIRVLTTERQVKAAEEGLITDRINKAVEGLGAEKTTSYRGRFVHWKEKDGRLDQRNGFIQKWGESSDIKDRLPDWLKDLSEAEIDKKELVVFGDWTDITQTEPNLEVRIGAIFALERIAQDSLRDHIQIMEILSAYVRQNSKPPTNFDVKKSEDYALRADVNAAIDVLLRRPEIGRRREIENEFRLNLEGAFLIHLDLRNTSLYAADFSNALICSCDFRRANLSGANFSNARLFDNVWFEATLRGTNFYSAEVSSRSGNILFHFDGAHFDGTFINKTTFRDQRIRPDALSKTYGTSGTRFTGVGNTLFEKELQEAFDALKLRDEGAPIPSEVRQVGCEHWSPHSDVDFANSIYLKAFRKKFELNSWPFSW